MSKAYQTAQFEYDLDYNNFQDRDDFSLWNDIRSIAGMGYADEGEDEYASVEECTINSMKQFVGMDTEFDKFFTKEKIHEIVEMARKENWNPYIGWDFIYHSKYNEE